MPTPTKRFRVPRKKIAVFCKRWKVREFSIFGSAIRKDFHRNSDVDVLITFWPRAKISVFDLSAMHYELVSLFGRNVDLVEKAGLRNPYRRDEILRTAKVVYAA
ncbi:MAG TPA: nucleotidyltransferase domain-containing protein [Anaerolineales bacterium]|nr:nucleotidyltransferase domain-containing protein [Anaerolineales bacterium]